MIGKIHAIYYNWYHGKEGEEFKYAKVGKGGVIKIKAHPTRGNGDRFYYTIFRKGEKATLVFNMNLVEMEDVEKDD